MILIVTEESDISSYEVAKWLDCFGERYTIITEKDEINSVEIELNEKCLFSINSKVIDIDDVTSVWYRRGRLNISMPEIRNIDNREIGMQIFIHLYETEWKTLESYIISQLNKKKILGNYFVYNTKKLETLDLARDCGLLTPKTFITTNKKTLHNLHEQHKLITKGVQDGISIKVKDMDTQTTFYNLTETVRGEDVFEMDDIFFPSLFQERIEKLFELRIFYLEGDFYSMAIFSQNNQKTKTDYRDYDNVKPNRIKSFKLPADIEFKLTKLLAMLNLNTASIDMIYTTHQQFVFLEINPVGQFDNISKLCNFNLEKQIAIYLSEPV